MSRLVTERDVQALAAGSRLVVEPGAIVTPAARDLAHARGIELAFGDAPAARGAPRCCPEHGDATDGGWPKLADGDWLVEVRDGKVRARRIER